ncbi:Hypothetical predicted protein, partial [Paramuricea clavata]
SETISRGQHSHYYRRKSHFEDNQRIPYSDALSISENPKNKIHHLIPSANKNPKYNLRKNRKFSLPLKFYVKLQASILSTLPVNLSERCDLIAKTVEESEAYSYQFNVKIVGVPEIAEKESAQQTANLCIKLFTALGAEDVSLNDIDTAHRVPSRLASSRPKAIVCKFVRRLAKE